MKILKVELNNISSYKGISTFDFTVENDKNIILIGGHNGAGKTSLFNAIKLALYGHFAFNYKAQSSKYISNIKEFINNDAFAQEVVQAYVEITILAFHNNHENVYTIKRSWNYVEKKLEETLVVYKEGSILNSEDTDIFNNYLFTILPPSLFEFAFFDGENIGDFFATNTYNSYIKKAFLTMSNLDTFEYIRDFANKYKSKSNEDNVSAIQETKITLLQEIEVLEKTIDEKNNLVISENEKLEENNEKDLKLETDFKNMGILRQEEAEKLEDTRKTLEERRTKANLFLRNFVEKDMPFMICKSLIKRVETQIDVENKFNEFNIVKAKLNSKEINDILLNFLENKTDKIEKLRNEIFSTLEPKDIDDISLRYKLNDDDKHKIEAIIRHVSTLHNDAIIKIVSERLSITDEITKINQNTKNAISANDLKEYLANKELLTKEKIEIENSLNSIQLDLTNLCKSLETRQAEVSKLEKELLENAKENSVFIQLQKIKNTMTKFNEVVIEAKFKELEVAMMSMIKEILRKDNFIDLIKIDKDFNISMYKVQDYTVEELKNILTNLGVDVLTSRIGAEGVNLLKFKLGGENLQQMINSTPKDTSISLYKNIEFNQLSKGERQIFILALYYSMIKVSNNKTPFIIDTPYARIDAEHRGNISEKFLPKISEQVIVLSTDEEIIGEYYDSLKPFISKEYLLKYNEVESKTEIFDKYY